MNLLKTILLLTAFFSIASCVTQRTSVSGSTLGNTRTQQVAMLDDYTYLLTQKSLDRSYGYNKDNPIKVGGVRENEGPANERRFLNALLGPNGEAIAYKRVGSCCAFDTPNGFDNAGLLDHYQISWPGAPDTLSLYINMYDKGDLLIPVGLNAKKR